MAAQTSHPIGVAPPVGQVSRAVVVPVGTRLLFVSGQIPRETDGATVGVGDMTVQAEQVFENLRAILAAHDTSSGDAVKATIFVTDIARVGGVFAVCSRFYGGGAPASTVAEVSAPGDPDWPLEVELVAAV